MNREAMPAAVQNPGFSVPHYAHPDYRIYEFNKRLQHSPKDADKTLWWDNLINEFFEDDAYVHLQYVHNDRSKRCSLNRLLIPRYFRTLLEGNVSRFHVQLYQPTENYLNSTIILDCEAASYVTQLTKPSATEIVTTGHLTVTFSFDELMRIQSWRFVASDHQEMVPRNVVKSQDPKNIEQLCKNITEHGVLNSTLAYLDFCVILEPMQEVMSRSKSTNMSPRECLRLVSMQKWHTRSMQRDFSPGGYDSLWSNTPAAPARSTPKRKPAKRKPASERSAQNASASKKKSPQSQGAAPAVSGNQASDFMVVGEPKLLGGEFWYGDERLITRVKNSQYTGTNGLENEEDSESFASSPLTNVESSAIAPSLVPDAQSTEDKGAD